jgi:hypothetical protein
MKRLAGTLALLVLAFVLGACQTTATLTGSLTLTVSGLPVGVETDITVSGSDGFSRELSGSATLGNLAPGVYQVSAESVAVGSDTYLPEPADQTVTVEAGRTATVNVAYSQGTSATGILAVDISGVPEDAEALVTVSGPEGFNQVLTGSATLAGLVPGGYTVTAFDIDVNGEGYAPEPREQSVTLEAGQHATATIEYRLQSVATGSLTVVVTGLPADATAAVTIVDGNGFTLTVDTSTTLSELAPGEYTVTAAEVVFSPYSYAATLPSQSVVVSAGASTQVVVAYAAQTGAVMLNIGGLPSGAAAAVAFGPTDAPADLIPASTLLELLSPGSYHVSAEATTFDGFRFEPDATSISIDVRAGETATVSIDHEPVDGKLLVVTEGLPGGWTVGLGKITGPGLETEKSIDTGTFLEGLEPGHYTFSELAMEVLIEDSWYTITMPSEFEVAAGTITTLLARFTPQHGNLTITISGLPDGVEAAVFVTGSGGFDFKVKHSTTLSDLAPGTYTITAENVADPNGGRAYEPCQHDPQNVTVVAAETATVSVHYAKPQEVIAQSHCVFFPPRSTVHTVGER